MKYPNGIRYNNLKETSEFGNSKVEILNSNDIITISFQESITDGSFNNVINDIIEREKDYTISNDGIMYQISTSNNQKIIKKNISTIDIGDCETILKGIYGIDPSIPLIIFKRDYFKNETLIPLIDYEVYHPLNYSKLDLSYCKNTISLNIPATINEDKIYQYDPNDDY